MEMLKRIIKILILFILLSLIGFFIDLKIFNAHYPLSDRLGYDNFIPQALISISSILDYIIIPASLIGAVYARNLGEKMAKILGDLNEFFDFNASGWDDTERDQINNEIGRQYGLEFPDLARSKLLEILINDYKHNLKIIESKLNQKNYKL